MLCQAFLNHLYDFLGHLNLNPFINFYRPFFMPEGAFYPFFCLWPIILPIFFLLRFSFLLLVLIKLFVFHVLISFHRPPCFLLFINEFLIILFCLRFLRLSRIFCAVTTQNNLFQVFLHLTIYILNLKFIQP